MNKFTLLFSLSCLLIFIACKSNKYTPTELSETRIHFGNGGGFVGAQNAYILLENGQLYQHDIRQDTMQALESVRRKTCKTLFKALETVEVDKLGANQPGNRYFFVEYITPDQQFKTTWGASGFRVDSTLKATYFQLMEQVEKE
ncbi:MAG: hypothetical protein AAF705_16330 [Bacteroidota bacterium]